MGIPRTIKLFPKWKQLLGILKKLEDQIIMKYSRKSKRYFWRYSFFNGNGYRLSSCQWNEIFELFTQE